MGTSYPVSPPPHPQTSGFLQPPDPCKPLLVFCGFANGVYPRKRELGDCSEKKQPCEFTLAELLAPPKRQMRKARSDYVGCVRCSPPLYGEGKRAELKDVASQPFIGRDPQRELGRGAGEEGRRRRDLTSFQKAKKEGWAWGGGKLRCKCLEPGHLQAEEDFQAAVQERAERFLLLLFA